MGKCGGNVLPICICSRGWTRRNNKTQVLSRWKWTTRWSKAAHVTIALRSRHRINPRPAHFLSGTANEYRWRPRRYQVDPWSRRREVARGVLHFFPKPGKRSIFCHRVERSTICAVCFPPTARWQVFLHQTPCRRPARITARFVNTVTRGWVGAPNERLPFRTHNLAASTSSPRMRKIYN